jgi:hypothetical protein
MYIALMLAADKGPDGGGGFKKLKPNFNFPEHGLAEKLMRWTLAVIAIACIAILFLCILDIVIAVRGKKEKNITWAIIGVFVSAIALTITLTGTQFAYGISSYF